MKTKKNKIIVITGGSGRFGKILRKIEAPYKILYPSKKDLNLDNYINIKKYLKKIKPNYLIHMGGLSRPLAIHEKNISKSIDLNIIGTSNITKVCSENNIKLIYFSTHYVYPGLKGNYKENDAIKPYNNYAWSKLGGECAVNMLKNSLILRICMTEKPFIHKKAFADVKLNYLFHNEFAEILFKLIDERGILNIGGNKRTVYSFAKEHNDKVEKIFAKTVFGKKYPIKQDMNLKNLKKIIKKYEKK